MTSKKTALIGGKFTDEWKRAFAAVAHGRGISESALLTELVASVIGDSISASPAEAPTSRRRERTSFRYRPGDGRLLEARAKARGMPPATYLAMLVHAHVRSVAPMPVEEVRALKGAVAALSAVGRNLNQIARAANAGGQIDGSCLVTVREVADGVDELRRMVASLVRANLMSWEGANA